MRTYQRSRSGRKLRYPQATIAAYGPDSTLATKLVVSVIERPGQRDPSAMRTWTTENVEIRDDGAIATEVAGFMQQHRVKDSIASERLLGDAKP